VGAPLWLETQNVTPDANGRYTIYLGANHTNGVPLDLFASAEARWLGVQPEKQPEQARILLTSVPYALTAGDAQTLGGQPLSAFVLASAANGVATASTSGAATANAGSGGIVALASPQATPSTVTTSGSALTNYLAKFTSTTDIENSLIYDTGTAVGIGTTTPAAMLHVATTTPPAAYFDIYSGSPTKALSTMPTVNRAARGTPPGTSPGPSAVQLNDYLVGMAARGYGTTGFASGGRAALRMQAADAWTDQNQGTFMSFWTSATQSTVSVEHMRIDPLGNVGIETTSPGQRLEVNGSIASTASSGGSLIFQDGSTQTTAFTGTTGGIYTAGAGLLLNGNSFSVTPCSFQAPVTGNCPAGSFISAININGTVTCTSVTGGPFATLGANSFSGTQTISSGNFSLPQTTDPTTGVFNLGGSPFIHACCSSAQGNTFTGSGAENFTVTGADNTANGSGAPGRTLSAMTTQLWVLRRSQTRRIL
jgi:hypothetical protein